MRLIAVVTIVELVGHTLLRPLVPCLCSQKACDYKRRSTSRTRGLVWDEDCVYASDFLETQQLPQEEKQELIGADTS